MTGVTDLDRASADIKTLEGWLAGQGLRMRAEAPVAGGWVVWEPVAEGARRWRIMLVGPGARRGRCPLIEAAGGARLAAWPALAALVRELGALAGQLDGIE